MERRCLLCDICENSLAGGVDSYSRGPEENPRLVLGRVSRTARAFEEGTQSG